MGYNGALFGLVSYNDPCNPLCNGGFLSNLGVDDLAKNIYRLKGEPTLHIKNGRVTQPNPVILCS